ncbi:lysM and putative peptidoglycan-binding domain-containing protein 3 [Anabrus simplex]|uniref:lysM and putative peptidoglycan-binding domain-containing protein 3 n=1 Tax=Anabrus simplex TaxID=316456 RepID=UPI0034DDB370
MGSNFKYWLNPGKAKRQRQNCHHRSSHYEETQYTLLQDSYDEYKDGGYALRSHNPTSYYEKKLEPGDTLLSLSLQFNCPVAELKRINGILRDNEIFARRSLKVPLKPGSVVTERLAGVHGSGSKDEDKLLINFNDPVPGDELSSTSNCSNEDISSANHSNIVDEKEQIVNHKPLGQNTVDLLSNNTYVEKILTQTVGSTSTGTNECADSSSVKEDPSSPLIVQDLPDVSRESAAILRCSGADWGLKWPQLLICSLLLGFAGPILYVLYITEKQHKSPDK